MAQIILTVCTNVEIENTSRCKQISANLILLDKNNYTNDCVIFNQK
jgi:hypothetical protein